MTSTIRVAHAVRGESAAVEEDRVGPGGTIVGLVPPLSDRLGPVPPQEGAQVLGNCRVGHERQAELLQARPCPAPRLLGPRHRGKEAVQRDRSNLGPGQLRLNAAADDPGAPPGDGDGPAVQQRLSAR